MMNRNNFRILFGWAMVIDLAALVVSIISAMWTAIWSWPVVGTIIVLFVVFFILRLVVEDDDLLKLLGLI